MKIESRSEHRRAAAGHATPHATLAMAGARSHAALVYVQPTMLLGMASQKAGHVTYVAYVAGPWRSGQIRPEYRIRILIPFKFPESIQTTVNF
jgi:hypothetical protein